MQQLLWVARLKRWNAWGPTERDLNKALGLDKRPTSCSSQERMKEGEEGGEKEEKKKSFMNSESPTTQLQHTAICPQQPINWWKGQSDIIPNPMIVNGLITRSLVLSQTWEWMIPSPFSSIFKTTWTGDFSSDALTQRCGNTSLFYACFTGNRTLGFQCFSVPKAKNMTRTPSIRLRTCRPFAF